MKVLRDLDPEQTKARKARRLLRRTYSAAGPNHVWYADGYDKLKLFGFPIHGCAGFKDMVYKDELRIGDRFQLECAWFVYSPILQIELDKVVEEWNTHTIRKSRFTQVWGKPNEMFSLPELHGFKKCGKIIDDYHVEQLNNERDVHSLS